MTSIVAEDKSWSVRQVRRVTAVGLLVNVSLASLKLVAGVLGNSQALVADGVHSLSDTVTDLAILIGVHFWSKPADKDHPYGHGRIETLVTAVIGLVLCGAAVSMALHGFTGIRSARTDTIGLIALCAALVSIVVKELLYQWTIRVARRTGSQALVANAWHQRSDAISSLPAVIAVLLASLWPSLLFLDSVGAIVVSALIFFTGLRITLPALAQLIDKAAPVEATRNIAHLAKTTPGVRAVSGIRTRYVGRGVQVDLCVEVDPDLSVRVGHEISEAVHRRLLDEGPGVIDVVVHIEPSTAPAETKDRKRQGERGR